MSKIIILIYLIGGLYTQAQDIPKPFNAINGVWAGQMPCADCEFISVRLNLRNDNVFEIRYTYSGKDVLPYTVGGSWNFFNDTLVLAAETGVKLIYFLSGNKLTLLDAEGNTVPNAMLTKLSRNGEDLTHESVERNEDRWHEKRWRGIDFTGMGNEPFWSVDVDLGGKIVFRSLIDDNTFEYDEYSENDVVDAVRASYTALNEISEIKVDIYKEGCIDDMSGEAFKHLVVIKHRMKKSSIWTEYKGCGLYLANYRLGGTWELAIMNGKPVSEYGILMGKDNPNIEINVSNDGLTAYMGCNRISGGFEAIGNKIQFNHMLSTKMMCDNIQLEQDFFSVFNGKQLEFKIEDKKLVFTDLSSVIVAEFMNVD
jgi:heat shock protein HslJ